jgi:hypothetical protein
MEMTKKIVEQLKNHDSLMDRSIIDALLGAHNLHIRTFEMHIRTLSWQMSVARVIIFLLLITTIGVCCLVMFASIDKNCSEGCRMFFAFPFFTFSLFLFGVFIDMIKVKSLFWKILKLIEDDTQIDTPTEMV